MSLLICQMIQNVSSNGNICCKDVPFILQCYLLEDKNLLYLFFRLTWLVIMKFVEDYQYIKINVLFIIFTFQFKNSFHGENINFVDNVS